MSYKINNIILIVVMSLSVIAMMIFGNNSLIKYMIIATDLLTILFLPTKYAIPNSFFMISFPAVYDIYGFKYLFNLTIFITFFKLLFNYKKLDKKYMFLLIIIFMIEFFDAFLFKKIDFEIVSFISLFISFITLSLAISNLNKIDVLKTYQSLFIGLLLSSLLAIFRLVFLMGGFNLTIYTRFIGFFRDPNYYSFFILLTGFSSFKIVKAFDIKINYYIVILLFGFLSVSKMFLLCFILCFIIRFFQSIKVNKTLKISKRKILYYVLSLFLLLAVFCFLIKSSFINDIYNLYQTRIMYQDLTTGRFDIIIKYLDVFRYNPFLLLFGSSNTYYYHIFGDYMRNLGFFVFKDMTTHNFYIELVASWGILGSIVFAFMIKRLYNIMLIDNNVNNIFLKNILLFVLLFVTSVSLCFLSADCFPLIIFFVLMYLCDDRLNYI